MKYFKSSLQDFWWLCDVVSVLSFSASIQEAWTTIYSLWWSIWTWCKTTRVLHQVSFLHKIQTKL